ncbi:MAG TPA: ATP-binding protein [Desulfobulbaceae bacterium]|nr:ATP-binding protein [Desulfobulbaceae bacterium]
MYNRDLYTRRIAEYLSTPVVKVITGMRRVGKSYFLKLIMAHLRAQGVAEARIIYIDMESLDYDFIHTYHDLNNYIRKKSKDVSGEISLFIDEIQEIENWEKCVASLLGSEKYDIFISGSNAGLLSSELATLLSGRYIEFPIYSLGLNEFVQFMGKDERDAEELFPMFLKFGGFPALHHFDLDQEIVYQYISSLYNTILLKDVTQVSDLA